MEVTMYVRWVSSSYILHSPHRLDAAAYFPEFRIAQSRAEIGRRERLIRSHRRAVQRERDAIAAAEAEIRTLDGGPDVE